MSYEKGWTTTDTFQATLDMRENAAYLRGQASYIAAMTRCGLGVVLKERGLPGEERILDLLVEARRDDRWADMNTAHASEAQLRDVIEIVRAAFPPNIAA